MMIKMMMVMPKVMMVMLKMMMLGKLRCAS